MLRTIRLIMGALLAAAALAGCSAQDTRQGISDAATTVTETISKASVTRLTVQLPSIQDLVEAGRTEEARAAFAAFRQGWETIRAAAQRLAPAAAAGIQAAVDRLQQVLVDTPVPSAEEVRAAVAELEQQLKALEISVE